MSTAREKLDEIVREGLAVDLYYADEANSLYSEIGQNADEINTATFGAFFGGLQLILGRYLILSTARLFDAPNSKYQIRSLPSAILLLRNNRETLAIEQRPGLLNSLVRRGAVLSELRKLTDSQLTDFVVAFFERQLSTDNSIGIANAQAFAALKTHRDKLIAHSEAVRPEELPKATFAEIDALLSVVRSFIAAVGFGYLSTAYEDDSGYNFMASDAKRSTTSMKRLLVQVAAIRAKSDGA